MIKLSFNSHGVSTTNQKEQTTPINAASNRGNSVQVLEQVAEADPGSNTSDC